RFPKRCRPRSEPLRKHSRPWWRTPRSILRLASRGALWPFFLPYSFGSSWHTRLSRYVQLSFLFSPHRSLDGYRFVSVAAPQDSLADVGLNFSPHEAAPSYAVGPTFNCTERQCRRR